MEQEPIHIFISQASATYREQTFKTKEPNRTLFSKIVGFMTAIFIILFILSETFD